MIRGVPVTEDRKPSFSLRRDWEAKMAAIKAADPTKATHPLPHWIEIVDAEGKPTDQFVQLARLFTPTLARMPFADAKGQPTDYALSWWKQVAG